MKRKTLLNLLKKPALMQYAEEKGVDVSSEMTKKQIADALLDSCGEKVDAEYDRVKALKKQARGVLDENDPSSARDALAELKKLDFYRCDSRTQSQVEELEEKVTGQEEKLAQQRRNGECLSRRVEEALEQWKFEKAESLLEKAHEERIYDRDDTFREQVSDLETRLGSEKEKAGQMRREVDRLKQTVEGHLSGRRLSEALDELSEMERIAADMPGEERKEELERLRRRVKQMQQELVKKKKELKESLKQAGNAIDGWEFEQAEEALRQVRESWAYGVDEGIRELAAETRDRLREERGKAGRERENAVLQLELARRLILEGSSVRSPSGRQGGQADRYGRAMNILRDLRNSRMYDRDEELRRKVEDLAEKTDAAERPAVFPRPSRGEKTKKVGIFAWENPQTAREGDVADHVGELSAALRRAGDEVHVFTRGNGQGERELDGVHYHFCHCPGGEDIVENARGFSEVATEEWQEDARGSEPFDVVVGFEWLGGQAVQNAAGSSNARSLNVFHSTEYDRAGRTFAEGISSRIRDAEKRAATACDRVVAASDATRERLLWLYDLPAQKVSVVHPGIRPPSLESPCDPEAIKKSLGFRPSEPLFVFLGDISEGMGADLLLEAVTTLQDRARNARFAFVGEGELRGPLEERADELGLSNVVTFTGHAETEFTWNLLRSANAAVLPCRSERPLKTVLWAWAAGKPVITTHTGPAEVVWHEVTGLNVFPNRDSLVWGIERLLHDGELCSWMGHNGRVAVEGAFTWDAAAGKLRQLYSE